MELIVGFILFSITCVICFYLPGAFVVKYLLKTENDSNWVSAWVIGIVLFILGNYIFSWLHVPYLYLLLILGVIIYSLRKIKSMYFLPKEKWDKSSLFIIFAGTLAFTLLSWNSGLFTSHGEAFIGLNAVDGITHLSYIKNQALFFPPQHPEIANIPLRGYHYFYDFLLSRFVLFFHYKAEDVFFRFAPIWISFLFGLSFYTLAKVLTKNILAQRLIVFFVYFGSGLSSFLSFVRPDFNPLTAQPIDIILDPSMILGITILVTVITLLPEIKKQYWSAVIIGILTGMLAQIKVYIGIPGLVMLFVFVLFSSIKSTWREKQLLFVSLCTAGVLLIITFFPNNFNTGRFIFAPFNFYNQFMQQSFFTKLHWGVVMAIYQTHKNYLRLSQMAIEAFVIYWVINIGIRLILIGGVRQVFQKSFWKSDHNIAIISIIGISVFFPSLFLQSPSPFEVMQFTWITTIFIGIPAGIFLGNFLEKKHTALQYLVIIFVVALCLPQTILLEIHYLFPKDTISFTKQHMAIFAQINYSVPTDSYYIVLPDRLTYTTKDGHLVDKLLWYGGPITSALTGKRAYYEDNATPFAHSEVVDERIHNMFLLSNAIQNCDSGKIAVSIQKIQSKYLLTYYPQPCLATSSAILKKQETNKYSFYQFR